NSMRTPKAVRLQEIRRAIAAGAAADHVGRAAINIFIHSDNWYIDNEVDTMEYYKNKLILITGGSSGIGLSLAKQLAEQEANVWILARRPGQLAVAIKEIEACRVNPAQKFGTIEADVSNEPEINTEITKFIEANGVPDILINAAGYARPGLFTDLDSEVFRQEMDVNYFGLVYTAKKIAPGMIARRSGHIINISSMAGFIGTIGYTAYCGAKFAVRGFTDTLRFELKKFGVRVSLVYPPDTRTPGYEVENGFKPAITKAFTEDNVGVFEPDYVAKVIIKDAAKGKYTILPGSSTSAWYFIYGLGMSFNLVNPVMDWMLSQSWRKVEKEAQQASSSS
ncbi:MAG TPA: SDR family oxidoreductase, partial [Anaerolineaceae bacterium]|nr:SDR family oxidoreductase [Anaerolineaceae bacterium]